MELLLNLAWLLLALPAYWLWRGRRTGRRFNSLQCLLALGCVLFILFPVVSATDDLRAMRSEMEESPAGKKSLRLASPDKSSIWKWQSPPALAGSMIPFVPCVESWHQPSAPCVFVPAAPAFEQSGRAPPVSFLG